VELIARDGNPRAYELHHVMSRVANCDFSFSGVKSWLRKEAEREEKKYGKKCQLVFLTFGVAYVNCDRVVLIVLIFPFVYYGTLVCRVYTKILIYCVKIYLIF